MPERATINSFSTFRDGRGLGSLPIIYRTGAGAEGMNGHACVQQAGSDTDLSLNNGYKPADAEYNHSVNMGSSDFTFMIVYGFVAGGAENTGAAWIFGAGRGNGTARSGLTAPQTHPSANNSAAWMQTIKASDSSEYQTLVGAHTDTTDGIRIGIYRRTGNTVKYYGTVTTGDTQVSHSTTNADLAHDIHFNGLLSDGDAHCIEGVKLAEAILWRSHLSDTQVLQLYQWAAARFGLTALTGADALLAGFTGDDERVFTMDANGLTSLSVSSDPITEPSVRLQVRDTSEQFRYEYDSTNYMSHTIASDGDITITNVRSDGASFTYDHNFSASGNGLLYTIKNDNGSTQLFLEGTADASVILADSAASRWRIRNDGTGSGENEALIVSVGGTTPVVMSLMPSGLMGVNTDSPTAALQVFKTTEQLRLEYSSTSYVRHVLDNAGGFVITAIDSVGGDPSITFNNNIHVAGHASIKEGNELRLYETDDTNYVGFEAPTLAGDQIYVLPTADGSANDFLQTDGAGTLTWAGGAYRKDVIGNIGDPQTYAEAGQPFFWEDRTGAGKGDKIYVAAYDGSAWAWNPWLMFGGI
jgi:hypothetical protein